MTTPDEHHQVHQRDDARALGFVGEVGRQRQAGSSAWCARPSADEEERERRADARSRGPQLRVVAGEQDAARTA